MAETIPYNRILPPHGRATTLSRANAGRVSGPRAMPNCNEY